MYKKASYYGFQNENVRLKKLSSLLKDGYQVNLRGKLIHRIVCRQAWGPFPNNWHVHHCDENKLNNSPSNLIAVPAKLHNRIHSAIRKAKVTLTRDQVKKMLDCYLKGLRSGNTQIIISIHVIKTEVPVEPVPHS